MITIMLIEYSNTYYYVYTGCVSLHTVRIKLILYREGLWRVKTNGIKNRF